MQLREEKAMEPEDMPTPETDACAKRCRDNLPFALASQNPIESIGDVVTVAHAKRLERRLALAVAALQSISEYWRCARTMTDACEHNRNVAAEALAQIEESI